MLEGADERTALEACGLGAYACMQSCETHFMTTLDTSAAHTKLMHACCMGWKARPRSKLRLAKKPRRASTTSTSSMRYAVTRNKTCDSAAATCTIVRGRSGSNAPCRSLTQAGAAAIVALPEPMQTRITSSTYEQQLKRLPESLHEL